MIHKTCHIRINHSNYEIIQRSLGFFRPKSRTDVFSTWSIGSGDQSVTLDKQLIFLIEWKFESIWPLKSIPIQSTTQLVTYTQLEIYPCVSKIYTHAQSSWFGCL